MNNKIAVAGRHSHFATQFWRPPKHVYPTRKLMKTAFSRKSIDRRLVLPLDAHNWARALEVVGARYARLGRTAEHYKQIVRNIVDHARAPGTTAEHRRSLTGAVDGVREKAYAEEIPVNSSLWSTMLWAYAELDDAARASDCFAQMQRRFRLSPATLSYAQELLLPVLCRHGHLAEAQDVVQHYRASAEAPPSRSGEPRAALLGQRGSAIDDQRLRRMLAEASARSGDWKTALAALEAAALTPRQEGSAADERAAALRGARTINTLFADHPRQPKDGNSVESAIRSRVVAPTAHKESSSTPAQEPTSTAEAVLSREARRQLFLALAQRSPDRQANAGASGGSDGAAPMLQMWNSLYGSWRGGDALRASPLPPALDVTLLINGLAAAGRWRDAVDVFAVYFMGREDGSQYLNADGTEDPRVWTGKPARDLDCLPLSPTVLELVFSAFPQQPVELFRAEVRGGGGQTVGGKQPKRMAVGAIEHPSLTLAFLETPWAAVRLLDDLLLHCDDMVLTDRVMATVGPALFQVGQYERCVQLLTHTPLFEMARQGRQMRSSSSPEQRHLQRSLAQLVYALHRCTTPALTYSVVLAFPFLFPPEVFQSLPPPAALAEQLQEARTMERATVRGTEAPFGTPGTARTDATSRLNEADPLSDDERYERAHASRRPTSVRPSRHHYFSTRSTTQLTEEQESAMQRNYIALRAAKATAFQGADADEDPRPIPKGLHDTASGWNFFGRGGEMVFPNNKRIPHPLSMQPKIMRSRANPYRGWSPRQNSSLAHKESVTKWNGSSSV